ncbi:MAG: FAD-dependent oxidoreductase [Verrucomicrobia bacterium]|nr:FAD-dependent oxidoreductase [Verrucomicrobiota bacterium]
MSPLIRFLSLALAALGFLRAQAQQTDVLIYGATPGGIAAAVAAAKGGRTVVLVEPTARIGGLVTSGLSHTDFHSLESLTGAFLDFARRVEAHYAKTYGKDSPQVRDSFHGTFAEPKVNLTVFEAMLAEHRRIVLRKQMALASVAVKKDGARSRIESVTFTGEEGATLTMRAKVFIDATYEGDLMAKAGVPWRVGREGRGEYSESLAPETADAQLQAYNFRFCMTKVPTNRVTPAMPPGYHREDFLGVLPALESGRIKKVFAYPRDCIFKAQTPPLPNGKFDINDVSQSFVRLSLPGKNTAWPGGDAAARAKIFAEHLRDQVGLLYFLQNDSAVPAKFRDEAREWGWCKDEFTETGHLPPQLYVREARRMVGVHVFAQRDSEHAPNDARAVLHRDAIAMGDYGNNCHGTAHEGPRFGGKHTGEFYNPVPPYQIPYGVLLPRDVDNLLVPVAASSSHVGFCALRLEPIWMSLGQAAGHAAALAVKENLAVQKVSVPALQRRLLADNSATIYVSDVLPGHADFAAVQWWGTAGGLHGLAPTPIKPRGKTLHGQYSEAAPGHAADLATPLDATLVERWRKLAAELGLDAAKLPAADGKVTRGDFIRAAAKLTK